MEHLLDVIPCPTHEGDSIYVHLSSGPKPYEEVLTFLRKGTELLKYGRIGSPKYHPFRLSSDDLELQWESKKGQIRRIALGNIIRWQRGQDTPVFRKHPQPKASSRSFSIVYVDENRRERTLDVICHTVYEFEMWFWGVQIICHYPPHKFSAPSMSPLASGPLYPPPGTSREAAPQPPTRVSPANEVPSFRSSVGDEKALRPTPKAKPMAGLSVMVGGRASGPMPGVPPPLRRDRRELGDLYVWGSLFTTEEDEWASKVPMPCLHPEAMREWQQSSVPVLVQNAGSMDVLRVACAPRHAALITRKGELYTWGYGKNGNLGHGWCTNLASPRLVTRMSGKGVRAVACGEGATAAISSDMRLFMWGSGMAGQLGNGYAFPCAEPMPVMFPGLREEVRVLTVSCGPYHTAAIIEGGLLFTWGNGLFGKLGHGSQASEYRPRRVEALEDKYVKAVSCGYWHTAAVAVSKNSARSVTTPYGSQATPAATPGTATTAPYPQPLHLSSLPGANGAGPSATVPSQAQTLAAAAGVPSVGLNGEGSSGRIGGRLPTSDMSSSGSDLQSVVTVVNAAGAANHMPAGHGSYGGSEGAAAPGAPLLGATRSDMLSSSVTSLDNLRDAPDEQAGVVSGGGMLYTWGGDFCWTERVGEHGAPKRDHHGGCLGHGDKEGRLLPTRVRGDLDKHGVVQVACGWCMTIALSADGRVYQMGSTGAAQKSGEKSCPWEGALVPTRVDGNLFGMYVEEVACGMHHVVVVASKVQANGHIPEDQRRKRLLTWGRGTEGQLGLDSSTAINASTEGSLAARIPQVDHHLPQIVAAVDGKRVLHISAGGNHTMAVLEHDPRTRRSHPAPPMASTPTNPYGTSAAATPSAAGHCSRAPPYGQPYHSVVGAVATGVRDVGNAATGLLGGMSSPFQITQSLPIQSAAAAVQSIGQVLVSSVGTRTKQSGLSGTGSVPGSGGGAIGAEASGSSSRSGAARGTTRRYQSGKVVTMPTPPNYGHTRIDHHRTSDLRRSATRQFASIGHGYGSKSSVNSHGIDPGASVSSGGMLSQRSSPPMIKGEEPESRSISPSSSSLYEISSAAGDFQTTRDAPPPPPHVQTSAHALATPADAAAAAAALDVATDAAATSLCRPSSAAASGGVSTSQAGTANDQTSLRESLSHGGHSIAETDGDTDSYFHGNRSLDMVPEQSEESPGSPVRTTYHIHHHHHAHHHSHRVNPGSAAAGMRGPPPYAENHETAQLGQVTSQPPSSPAAAHSRVSMLAQPSPPVGTAVGNAVGGVSVGDNLRASISTMDSSYTTTGESSRPSPPSAIGTPSPDTPEESHRSHTPRVAGPGVPYPLVEETPSSPHPVVGPYVSHLLASSPSALQAQPGAPLAATSSRHVVSLQQQDSLGRYPPPAGAVSTVAGAVSGTGRPREVSISAWAQPGLSAAVAAAVASAGTSTTSAQPGGGGGGGGGAQLPFRGEVSFRAFNTHPGERSAAATAVSSGAVASGDSINLNAQRTSNATTASLGPVGPRAGSRGSRGHSRHASYDSLDIGVRDGDVLHGRSSNMAAGTFELVPPAFVLSGGSGGSGVHTPPRLTGPTMTPIAPPNAAESAATLALKQQNEVLQQQIEMLKQQVALLAQAAGIGAAATVAGSAAAATVGGHAYPTQPPPSVAAIPSLLGSPGPAPPHVVGPPATLHHAGNVANAAAVAAVAAAAAAALGDPGSSNATVYSGGSGSGMHPLAPILSPAASQAQPQQAPLHHASSITVATLGERSYGAPPAVAASSPSSHGLPPLGPGAGSGSNRALADRHASAAGGLPVSVAPPPPHPASAPPTGHRRSVSIDVSSMIATRDGIGPAKDYLAPAFGWAGTASVATATAAAAAGSQGHPHHLDRIGSRDGRDGAGHHTAPPALETLRHAHPGMSLAQAALAEADEEGLDEEDEDNPEDSVEGETEGDDAICGEPSLGRGEALKGGGAAHGAARRRRQQQGHPGEPAALVAMGGARTDVSENSSWSGGGGGTGGFAVDGVHSGEVDEAALLRARHHRQSHTEAAQHNQQQLLQLGSGRSGGGAYGGLGGGAEESGGSGCTPGAPAAFPPTEGATFQYAPGVFIMLRPPSQPGCKMELCKLRFSRRQFSQVEAQQWWAANKAQLYETYHVTASVGSGAGAASGGSGGGGGGSRTATPAAYPASPSGGAPPPPPPAGQSPAAHSAVNQHVSGSVSHTRGLSTDTQGTSAGSGGAGGSMYFSIPAVSPSHALGAGSNGGAAGCLATPPAAAAPGVDLRAYWGPAAAAVVLASDPYASWADHVYEDTSGLVSAAAVAGAPLGMPPRHHRTRSGSRNASGGASNSSMAAPAPAPPHHLQQQPALQQWPAGSGSAGGPGSGTGAPGGEGHPATAAVGYPTHKRTPSGGASSNMS